MKEQQTNTTLVIPTLDQNISDQWEMTKGITTPRFSIIENICPEQQFRVIILIGSYEIVQGKTHLEISCQIENKTGDMVSGNTFERTLVAEIDEHIGFILLPELPEFTFRKTDEEGAYTVVATITDSNSGEKEVVKTTVLLSKTPPIQLTELEGELEDWRQNYYLDPKPQELIPRYLQSIDEIGMNNNANIQFYVEALNNALFLLEEINQLLIRDELPQKKRNALNLLIARSNYRGPDLDGFSQPELEILHQIREEDEGKFNPLQQEALTHPTDLDSLWSLFFANGKYENIEKIISALSFLEGRSMENIQDAPELEMIQYAMGMASAWSLNLNSENHPLVKVYLIHAVNNPETPEFVRNELMTILQNAEEESDSNENDPSAIIRYTGTFYFPDQSELEDVLLLLAEEDIREGQSYTTDIDQLTVTVHMEVAFSEKDALEETWNQVAGFASSGMILVYHDEQFEDVICASGSAVFTSENPALLMFSLAEFEQTFGKIDEDISEIVYNSPFYIYDQSLKNKGPVFENEQDINDADCKTGFDILDTIWGKHIAPSDTPLFSTIFKQEMTPEGRSYTIAATYGFVPGYTMEEAIATAREYNFRVFNWDEFWKE